MADGNMQRTSPDAHCGCFECMHEFAFKDISEFWDNGEAPVCPFCGCESVVIGTADMDVTADRLKAMRRTW